MACRLQVRCRQQKLFKTLVLHPLRHRLTCTPPISPLAFSAIAFDLLPLHVPAWSPDRPSCHPPPTPHQHMWKIAAGRFACFEFSACIPQTRTGLCLVYFFPCCSQGQLRCAALPHYCGHRIHGRLVGGASAGLDAVALGPARLRLYFHPACHLFAPFLPNVLPSGRTSAE